MRYRRLVIAVAIVAANVIFAGPSSGDTCLPAVDPPGRQQVVPNCSDAEPHVTVIATPVDANHVIFKVNTTGWDGLGRIHLEAKYYRDGVYDSERSRDCAEYEMCSLADRTLWCGDPASFHQMMARASAWSLTKYDKYRIVYGDDETICN